MDKTNEDDKNNQPILAETITQFKYRENVKRLYIQKGDKLSILETITSSILKLWMPLCVLCEFFVSSVVNFNHREHGGYTKGTKKYTKLDLTR